LNIEGRIRRTKKAIIPFKFLFTEFDTVKGLLLTKKKKINHNFSILKNFHFLSFFKNLICYNHLFVLDLGYLAKRLCNLTALSLDINNFHVMSLFLLIYKYAATVDNLLFNTVFNRTVNNYYSLDMFSKNSKVMSLCSIKIIFSNFSITQ